jgi:hypothetical protein
LTRPFLRFGWKMSFNTSTFIDLKAELLKKEEEFAKQKADSGGKPRPRRGASGFRECEAEGKGTKLDIKAVASSSPNAAVEQEVLDQSRRALEAKSRLYEQLERGTLDVQGLSTGQKDGLLVDFAWKGWNAETGEFDLDPNASDTSSDSDCQRSHGTQQSSSDDWIEYEDEFGRQRLVRRGDLAALAAERAETARLLSRAQDEPLHYTEDFELRNRGVAFYRFAGDERERVEQMGQLRRLRAETMETRTRLLALREQRRLHRERRLALLKHRRLATRASESLSVAKEDTDFS